MNFRQLEAFQATMRFGTVTAASRALNITQPSVSRLLSDLEYATGLKLFNRRRGRLQPTPEAELFFDEVERSFGGLETLRRTAEQLKNQTLGRLRIGTVLSLSLGVVHEALGHYARKNRKTAVSLFLLDSDQTFDQIANYRLDLGVVPQWFNQPVVTALKTYHMNCVVILPPGHELCGQKVLAVEDLGKYPFICVDRPWMLERIADRRMRALVEKPTVFEVNHFFNAGFMVEQGVGIAVMDQLTAAFFVQRGLVQRHIEATVPYEVNIIHCAQKPLSLAVKNFLPILMQKIEAMCRRMKRED